MPLDMGIGFLVIQHLNAEHPSLLAELLSKYTAMPVVQAEDGTRVEPNRIYLIPPNTYMTVKAGVLILKPPSEARGIRMPIDRFLCSLAEDCQDYAIAIVLSGSGSDGTLRVREVKANGGMVMAQDPSAAQYDGIPRSTIATGRVDTVLAPEWMPEVLVRNTRHAYIDHEVEVPRALTPANRWSPSCRYCSRRRGTISATTSRVPWCDAAIAAWASPEASASRTTSPYCGNGNGQGKLTP